MPTIQDIENFMRQNGGQQLQGAVGPNSPMAQGAENGINSMAMKQAALQQLAGSPQAAPAPVPVAPPQGLPIPEVQPNAASMSPQDAQSRMGAMIQAPATMDQVAAKLRAQADQDAAAEQHANALQDQDMSGYSDYGKPAAPPAKFQQLKQKIQGKPQDEDIRSSLKGPVEVTPEMEKKLGYNKDEDEE